MAIALPVQVTDDLLMRLRREKPLLALAELLWNAFDADATKVTIHFERNPLGAVEAIKIIDNGHGIDYEQIESLFGQLGGSHKLSQRWSPKGRRYHGSLGQGRYKAFALGSRITWTSYYRDKNGQVWSFEIRGTTNNLKVFEVTSPTQCLGHDPGVEVNITVIEEEVTTRLDSVKVADDLCVLMAPYLRAYPDIKLSIDGIQVNPTSLIDREVDKDLIVESSEAGLGGRRQANVRVKILEWKTGVHRNKYLCNMKGIAFDEGPSGIRTGLPSYSIYVMSDYIEQLWLEGFLDHQRFDRLFSAIENEVDRYVRGYFRERLAEEAETTVVRLKEEGVYPYQGEPQSQVERAERQVFDICVTKITQFSPDFAKTPKQSKHLSLVLLQQALRNNASSLRRVLEQVLNLNADEVQELDELLQHTSLQNIINTASLIRNRLLFLKGLRQMVFDPVVSKTIKERQQLHKILVDNLWVFGEQYRYGTDDSSLKNVLLQHLSILGRNEPQPAPKGLNDIPDLMLWRRYPQFKEGHFEHLIIELKRPNCDAGMEEFSQINRYAQQVISCPAFDKESTKWTFMLLVRGIKPELRSMCNQSNRDPGLVVQDQHHAIWIKEWSEVVQQAEWRLKFLEDSLELAVEEEAHGLNWLRQRYAHILG